MKINVLLQSQYFFQVLPVLSSAWGVYVGEQLERIFRKMLSGKERDHRSDQWNFHRKENWNDLILSTGILMSGTSYVLLVTLANKLLWENIIKKYFCKTSKTKSGMQFQNELTCFYKTINMNDCWSWQAITNVKVLAKCCLISCVVVHDHNVQMFEKTCPFTTEVLKGQVMPTMMR